MRPGSNCCIFDSVCYVKCFYRGIRSDEDSGFGKARSSYELNHAVSFYEQCM